jgi:hypothetical protein
MGHHNILLAGGTTLAWSHCMSVTFGQVPRTGPSRAGRAALRDYRVGPHDVLLAGGTILAWAHCMSVTFGQLARIGPSRIWRTTARDHRMGRHNILLGEGASPLMGPLHERNIWKIGSH